MNTSNVEGSSDALKKSSKERIERSHFVSFTCPMCSSNETRRGKADESGKGNNTLIESDGRTYKEKEDAGMVGNTTENDQMSKEAVSRSCGSSAHCNDDRAGLRNGDTGAVNAWKGFDIATYRCSNDKGTGSSREGKNGSEANDSHTSDSCLEQGYAVGMDEDLRKGLMTSEGPKVIPVKYLYDDRGSELYEKITGLEEYYPYLEEKRLLEKHAEDIVARIPPGSVVVELGCGDGSKTSLLLNALIRRDGTESVKFAGIDVSQGALDQAYRNLKGHCPHFLEENVEFICAEYLSGLKIARSRHPNELISMLWLGSSVGNFVFEEAIEFMTKLKVAAGDNSSLLLCCDLWKKKEVLQAAYDDSLGVTRSFIINGMNHALRTLGHSDSDAGEELWKYTAHVNEKKRQVEMWIKARRKVVNVLPGMDICPGEEVLMEISRKFTHQDISALAQASGFSLDCSWSTSRYSIQMLLPWIETLQRSWSDTEALFDAVPNWSSKPIGLRHPFCFYYGHIAAFYRLKCFPNIGEISPMDEMFSRGIDPNVVDPSQCHSHPDTPDHWPTKEELLNYVSSIRKDIRNTLISSSNLVEHFSERGMFMALEHERMHQETLCYLIAQERKNKFDLQQGRSDKDGAASLFDAERNGEFNKAMNCSKYDITGYFCTTKKQIPSFYFNLTRNITSRPQCLDTSKSHEFVRIRAGDVTYGISSGMKTGYVWDNERGTHGSVHVKEFEVGIDQVTIADFYKFVFEENGYSAEEFWEKDDFLFFQQERIAMPATWSRHPISNEIWVHMPDGSYHWEEVAHQPVFCSLAEAEAFAKKHNSRIITEAEYEHLSKLYHLEEPNAQLVNGMLGDQFLGWEWTSTLFRPFEGFKEDSLYPEYSTDFFDDAHYVLRGMGCSYTHPSIRRSTFRNFYQR